jgi:hypothetical protein
LRDANWNERLWYLLNDRRDVRGVPCCTRAAHARDAMVCTPSSASGHVSTLL